ncbi:MAG: hypothetical protein ACK2UY_09850 [Anaerolineae bacterium]
MAAERSERPITVYGAITGNLVIAAALVYWLVPRDRGQDRPGEGRT